MQTKFKGFEATTDKGTPCFVKNHGTLEDGTPAYKVQLGSLGGYSGWSGGAYRQVHYTGKTGWIAQSKVTRGRAK